MPDNQTNTTTVNEATKAAADAAAAAQNTQNTQNAQEPKTPDLMPDVAAKISDAHNILVALSSDPTVDELAAAIGLSLCLDRAGKRATAIYSGSTPNALEFLKPDETFESSADALKDFVIALDKDKADHLRYKLDGDYVKIFITPYKSHISEEDLEFSYGDFNVDLVLALNVANGVDLDAALREHGRIMHDATVINITTGNPGKFGEIEWSDKSASSVSEMSARLLYSMNKNALNGEEATAFLTGIVAATNRFLSAATTASTMETASRLMSSGADQQLISKNITAEVDNELFTLGSLDQSRAADATALDIDHSPESEESTEASSETPAEAEIMPEAQEEAPAETPETPEPAPESPESPEPPAEAQTETPEEALKAAEDSLSHAATETVPEVKSEKVILPPSDFTPSAENNNKYGQMLEDALAEEPAPAPSVINSGANPAAALAPEAPVSPEINSIPDINYAPAPDDLTTPTGAPVPNDGAVLPPPPAPPTNTMLPPNPAVPDQLYPPQVSDPAAFKIPGMPA